MASGNNNKYLDRILTHGSRIDHRSEPRVGGQAIRTATHRNQVKPQASQRKPALAQQPHRGSTTQRKKTSTTTTPAVRLSHIFRTIIIFIVLFAILRNFGAVFWHHPAVQDIIHNVVSNFS